MTEKLRDNFCVLIVSHGRAGRVTTLNTLKKCGYTGQWYIVVDDLDEQQEEYKRIYGAEHVVVFDKHKYAEKTDSVDNFHDLRSVVYARNAVWGIARKLGFRYFLMLDDDYSSFEWRYLKDNNTKLGVKSLANADAAFEMVLQFLDSGLDCVALAQGGDFIGGAKNADVVRKKLDRKIMNTFFCDIEKEFHFLGIFNDDVNTYIDHGVRGKLFLTIWDLSIHQEQTQSNKGGLTDIYLNYGTFVKSFYSVIVQPSVAHIAMMQCAHSRIHHVIKWNNCAPKLISDRWKKK